MLGRFAALLQPRVVAGIGDERASMEVHERVAEELRELDVHAARDQDRHDAERRAPQTLRISAAFRDQSDAEAARQRVDALGERERRALGRARQHVAGEAGEVVLFDGERDAFVFTCVQRVEAAHVALQLGELADHLRR